MEKFDEDIWPQIVGDLTRCRETGEPILTIARRNRNWVLEVEADKIVVKSEKNERGQPNGSPRDVVKDVVKEAWELLREHGRMNRHDMSRWFSDGNKIVRTGAVIRGILARLPNVTVERISGIKTLVYKKSA